MRTSRRTQWRRTRDTRLAVEYLEDRSVPAAAMFFDPVLGDVTILGTDQNDRFTLAADLDGNILVTHNRMLLQAIDPNTNQPAQVDPNVWNTDSIRASLGAGDDVFDLFGDRFQQLGLPIPEPIPPPIEILGEAGNDLLIVRAPSVQSPSGVEPPPPYPLAVRFDGGDGPADSLRLIATDADERLDVVSMNDFHDVTLSINPAFVKAEALATERLYFDLAGGEDIVDARYDAVGVTAPEDFHFNFDLGIGDDTFSWSGATPAWLTVDASLGDDILDANFDALGVTAPSDLRFDLGGGDDLLSFAISASSALPAVQQPIRLDVDAGIGHDRIDGVLEAFGLIAVWDAAIDLGGGDDVLNLQLTSPDSLRLSVRGGTGDDVVDLVGLTAPSDNHWDIGVNLGAGDDVMSWSWAPADPAAQTGSLDMRLNVIGGSGADVVDLVGYHPHKAVVDIILGAGHDEFGFDVNAAGVTTPDRMDLRLNVLGGTGNDVVDLVGHILPFNAVFNVNISLGSGADTAVVAIPIPEPLPPPPQATRSQLNVNLYGGSGRDEMEVWLDLPQNVALGGRVRVLGSAGNDALALFADGNTSALDLLIDGGLGRDTAEKRGKVRIASLP